MILPIVLNLALSLDKPVMFVHSQNEKYCEPKVIYSSHDAYQFTTKDINLSPYDYIKQKDTDIIYQTIAEELLQDEEGKK